MSHRYRQHRYIAAVFFAALLLIGGGDALLQSTWIPEKVCRWTCAAVLALLILIWRILIAFAKEPGKLPEAYFPGLANQLTIFRGLLICLLVGFLFLNPPEGFLAWIPGFLYSTALIMDGFDGYLARLCKETSAFGAFLDRDLDALGTLIGVLLAVHYTRLPDWYILAGMAYYLFACGEWWREKCGLPLRPLPASRYRRHVAVVQSVFIALALLPVSVLPKSDMTAALVMIPVLAGFLRDWRIVAGYDLRALSSE
ncbi:MAG TPA: CDP-alcohol phosphatidyltransferase family protein [Syntrophales bacterium]|jgi:CDP-diacylglycerol--glycerol-3-phosphate 3-phosphatidyltransferase